jgi:HK97 family phage prohead protease
MPEIMQETEIRGIQVSSFEIRTQEDGSKIIEGYAMEWEKLSQPLGWFTKFREKFQKGAFRDYLAAANSDTKFLVGHDINRVLARTKNQTLELKEDDRGLFYRVKLPNTTLGNDSYESVKRGDVDGISVGFRMLDEEWDESDEANITRTVTKANLPEISLTAWPAYESTSANTRSNDPYKQFKDSRREEKPPEADLRSKLDHIEWKNNLKSRA